MARSREDIVKDRLEETRLEIDRQQTIIDNDRKSAKEKEAAKKRQLVLIERELAIQERLASIEEQRIRQQERANIAQEKAADIQKKAAEKQEQLYESFKDSLHDQLLSLKKKAKAERTISEDGQKQLNLAYKYQHLLKQAVTEKDGEIQINETLLKQLKKEYKEKNRALQDSIELNEIEIKLKQKQLDLEHKIKKAQMTAAKEYVSGLESNMRKIPLVGDFMANTLMSRKAQRKLTAKFYKYFRNDKGLMNAMSKLQAGPALGLISGGIGLAKTGLKMTLKREQDMKDQQRSIGLTNEQSNAVDSMQSRLLFSSKSMVTSMEEARKASAELVDDFGTYGAENETLVDQQVKLTKAYGLQAEDASNFQRTAKIAGKDTEVVKKEVFAIATGFNKATGSTQSLSAVLRAVSKVSDSIRIQFRGSDTELTHAVMKAKMLGTTLEDLNGIADQLLNIESSIENQVTAQLVTGRNINMDKARMFALQDDMNGLMDELVKQEIDYNSYSKMNRVEKQSTAAALGMNVDQMAKFVSQQELARKLNIDMAAAENQTAEGLQHSLKGHQERIAQMAKEGDLAAQKYEADNEALTTQEKMNSLIEMMTKGFKFLGPVLVGIGAAIVIIGIGLLKAAIAAAGLTTALSGGLMGFAIAAGVAVAAGAVIGAVQMVQDGVAPASNGPFTITDRKGNIGVTSAGDGLIATPNKPGTTNSQPTVNVSLVVGNTAIKEIGNKISMNNSYNAGVGNSYNRLG